MEASARRALLLYHDAATPNRIPHLIWLAEVRNRILIKPRPILNPRRCHTPGRCQIPGRCPGLICWCPVGSDFLGLVYLTLAKAKIQFKPV